MPRFAKYHGLGNDFLVLDRLAGGRPPSPEQAVRLCDRRRGVGADGVLTLLPSVVGAARMHVTNADGSVAETCGNGLRCAAKYLADEAGFSGDEIALETFAGVSRCRLRRGPDGRVDEVTVDLGAPVLEPAAIPMALGGTDRFVRGELVVGGRRLRGTALSLGNPHLVLFEEELEEAAELGPVLERHPLFPSRTNVEWVRIDGERLEVRVWERGCGLTAACGTGACAAVVAAVLEGRLAEGEERVVRLPGGELRVRVLPGLTGVEMTGPATRVFEGGIEEKHLISSE